MIGAIRIVFCGFFVVALLFYSLPPSIHAQRVIPPPMVDIQSENYPLPTDASVRQRFVPNQVIIKYKPGQSPHELEMQIIKRQNARSTLPGFVWLFVKDLTLKIRHQESAEEKLAQIERVDALVGVEKKDQLFRDNHTMSNFYVIIFEGSLSVEKVIELYKQLPEVEIAEPNYIHTMQAL